MKNHNFKLLLRAQNTPHVCREHRTHLNCAPTKEDAMYLEEPPLASKLASRHIRRQRMWYTTANATLTFSRPIALHTRSINVTGVLVKKRSHYLQPANGFCSKWIVFTRRAGVCSQQLASTRARLTHTDMARTHWCAHV